MKIMNTKLTTTLSLGLMGFAAGALLIVVVVVMDFMSQLQAHLMSHHYPGLLKKANLLGYGRSGSGS